MGKKDQNRRKELAILQAKPEKSEAEMQAIASLQAKLAKASTGPPKSAKAKQVKAAVRIRNPQNNQGTGAMLTPASYKSMLMANPSRVATTGPGRAYYHKAIHPPSAPDADFAGLPDYTSQPRVTPEYTTNVDLKWDATMFPSAPSSPDSFDIQIFVPDIPEIALLYRLKDVKNSKYSDVRVVRTSPFESPVDEDSAPYNSFGAMGDSDFSMGRITTSSVTGIYSGTTLGDAGMVYAASISPQLTVVDYAALEPVPSATAIPQTLPGWHVAEYLVPQTTKALMQVDPMHYRGRARAGVFAVQKFDESLMGYRYSRAGTGEVHLDATHKIFSIEDVMAIIFSDTGDLDSASKASFTSDSRIAVPDGWSYNPNLTSAAMHGGITQHSGMAWTVIFIEGLSIAQAESFAFERRITMDLQIPAVSPMAALIKAVPEWDEQAIKSVMKFQRLMPSGMPSDCNGFMDWVRGIFSFLNKNKKPILDVVKVLPIPGAGIAADIAENVLPTVDGLLSGSTI